MTLPKETAVFLDRDGTVNVDYGFVSRPEDVKLLPGVGEAIRELNQAGIPVFIISNQSGVGRGLYGLEAVSLVNREVERQLDREGAKVKAFYFCPHAPEEGCECRKPKLGMLKQAQTEWGVDLAQSFVVGDKPADAELGKNAGGKGIVVLTGQTKQEDIASWAVQPDFVAGDLIEAVDWILKQENTGDS
jgi:histidinol-phosphate phosphatase family protein